MPEQTLDLYAPLSHKRPLTGNQASHTAPTWVPADHQRRLTAYKVYAAYLANVARWYLPAEPDSDDVDNRREYGDADLLVSRVVAGVLGDQPQITVDGADDDLPDEPDIPPRPDPPADNATPIEQRVARLRQDRWEQTVAEAVDEWEAAWTAQPTLRARQQWLRDWADDEQLPLRILEAERDAVGLGDAVYVLAWSGAKQRPIVDVYDPGFYFPVLTDTTRGYPDRIHLAWEFEDDGHRYVRRLTFELTSILAGMIDPDTGDYRRDPTTDSVLLAAGDTINADGDVVRTYPWATEPTNVTCLFTDATWPYEQLDSRLVDDLDPAKATYAITETGDLARRLDLRIDFVPVVHVPNTPTGKEHFGKSILAVIAQLLDDIHASDTDVQEASAMAAGPAVALTGGTAGAHTVRPGVVWNLPENGRMDVLDLSAGLEQLGHVNTNLRDLLSVNARVPAEVLGRVKASEVPSGVTLALAFGPFTQLIDELRLVRDSKYRLLLKMVQRLAQTGGALEPGENPTARLAFGAYLPSDLGRIVELAVALLQAHGISRRTALRMLVDAGVDIGDLVDELARIDTEDTSSALQVAEATGSEELAAARLGIELPQQVPIPAPTLDLGGGGAG